VTAARLTLPNQATGRLWRQPLTGNGMNPYGPFTLPMPTFTSRSAIMPANSPVAGSRANPSDPATHSAASQTDMPPRRAASARSGKRSCQTWPATRSSLTCNRDFAGNVAANACRASAHGRSTGRGTGSGSRSVSASTTAAATAAGPSTASRPSSSRGHTPGPRTWPAGTSRPSSRRISRALTRSGCRTHQPRESRSMVSARATRSASSDQRVVSNMCDEDMGRTTTLSAARRVSRRAASRTARGSRSGRCVTRASALHTFWSR